MPVMKREELKKIIEENNLKTMEDVGEFITNLEKEMIEAILQGEIDAHLGYAKYDYENKKTEDSRNGYTSKRSIW